MSTINVKLYDILRQDFKLSDAKAKEFAEAIHEVASESTSMTEFKSAIKEDLLKLELKFVSKIKDTKIDVYKGIFISSVVQLIAILGSVIAIVKYMVQK